MVTYWICRDLYYPGDYFGDIPSRRGGIRGCANNIYRSRNYFLAGRRGATRLIFGLQSLVCR